MPNYRVGGINVRFPYKAYDCQLVYMERVIQALQQGSNALLESPTGTGKTLCLLCATLAWRESMKRREKKAAKQVEPESDAMQSLDPPKSRLPTILYASRTHSQLHQVIRELKATSYRPKMIVLGSREQMCIHADVQMMRGKAQNHACRSLVKDRRCHHQTRVTDYIKANPDLGTEPIDIEDLVNIGKAKGPCPYYLSRELHSTAEIVFLPYNYLVEKDNRRSLTGINWEKTVLIFDEAHNLESLCADAASFDLPAAHLTACITEAKQCMDLSASSQFKDNGADTSVDSEHFAVLKALICELEKRISEIPIESKELGFTAQGSYIYELLDKVKINWQTAPMLINTIEQATSLLEDDAVLGQVRASGASFKLLLLRDALKLIFRGSDNKHASCYKVHVQEVRSKDDDKGGRRVVSSAKTSRTLSWWCFNPGIAMEEFASMGIRSVILTSGTLAPLDSFALELKLPFNVRLENPHVVDSNQIWVGVVPTGPSGRPLNSSYRTRDTPEYRQELGNTIVNFSRIVPDGLLVFFPSYYLLNACIQSWQGAARGSSLSASTIWERICKNKQPVVEPRESASFNQANESFMTKLSDKSSSGAIFFAVCRGKVSEGLDFADKAGRAVVVTGIPYAMKTEPKVRLKREYLDEAIKLESGVRKGLTGEQWYVQQAARAVNQAVGRVIRHRHDYGAIILCDERFAQRSSQSQMSLWLRPHVQCYTKFGDTNSSLTRFFRDRKSADLPPLQKDSKDTTSLNLQQSLQTEAGLGADRAGTASISIGQLSGSSLNAASIAQANSLVGSASGILNLGSSVGVQGRSTSMTQTKRNESSVAWSMRATMPSAVPAVITEPDRKNLISKCSTLKTSSSSDVAGSSSNYAKKRQLEASEHLESTSKHGMMDGDQIECCSRESPVVTISTPDEQILETKNQSISGNVVRTMENGASGRGANAKTRVGEGLTGRETKQQKQGLAAQVSSSNPQTANAVQYLRESEVTNLHYVLQRCTRDNSQSSMTEVKARLSTPEYSRFLECMRSLKTELLGMAAVLDTVSNLFSAPERRFLFRRFGEFIPSKYRRLFEERLAARGGE